MPVPPSYTAVVQAMSPNAYSATRRSCALLMARNIESLQLVSNAINRNADAAKFLARRASRNSCGVLACPELQQYHCLPALKLRKGAATALILVSTILIVDDEALFRHSIRRGLQAHTPSVVVMEAGDGVAALDILKNNTVDLLITDVHMPEMDGVQLLVEMSQRQLFMPTIVVSAHSATRTVPVIRSFGALGFVNKPVDLNELVADAFARIEQHPSDILRGVSLAGFVQLLSMERRTCSMHVTSKSHSGVLVFVNGELVDATTPNEVGTEAALEMARWPAPALYVEAHVDAVVRSIDVPLHETLMEAACLQDDGTELAPSKVPTLSPQQHSDTTNSEEKNMSNIEECIEEVISLDGAIAAALVDFESGLTLGTRGGGREFDVEVAASGNTQVVRSKMFVMEQLGLKGRIEDILITLETQYHLIRPLKTAPTLFLYVAIDRKRGNLGLARHRLKAIEAKIVV